MIRTRPLNFKVKSDKIKYVTLEIPIYLGWLYIAVGNLSEIRNSFLPDEPVEVDEGIAGRCTELDKKNWLISFDTKSVGEWGIAAHEAAHFVHMLFDARDVTYTLNNDEHYCYMLTWVVNQIQEAQSTLSKV